MNQEDCCSMHGVPLKNGKCYFCARDRPQTDWFVAGECSCGYELPVPLGATRVVCPACCEVWLQKPVMANSNGREMKWIGG